MCLLLQSSSVNAQSQGAAVAKITVEMVSEFIRLHQQGYSYRAIGRTYKVDSRTVKDRIDKAKKAKEEEYWEAVSRQVDARYLDEHYRLLVHVALAVLNAVRTQPLFTRTQDGAEALLHRMTESGLGEPALDLLAGRGVDLDTLSTTSVPDEIGETPKRRLVHRLLDGLMEHEAGLSQAVDQWEESWDQFQHHRADLGQQANGLFVGKKIEEGVATALGAAVADEVLGSTLLHREMGALEVEACEEGKTTIVLIRGSSGEADALCSGPERDMRPVVGAYACVLSQLRHKERIGSVVAVYKSLRKSVSRIEDLVDILVLKGHPWGRCALCVNSLASAPRIIAAGTAAEVESLETPLV